MLTKHAIVTCIRYQSPLSSDNKTGPLIVEDPDSLQPVQDPSFHLILHYLVCMIFREKGTNPIQPYIS